MYFVAIKIDRRGEAYRRIGVSAFRRTGSSTACGRGYHDQEFSTKFIRLLKRPHADPPTRRYADTPLRSPTPTRFLVCINLTVIAGIFLLQGPLRAADDLKPPDIRVQAAGFGTANTEDVRLLLQSAALELWRYCPRTRLDGIDVYHRVDHPQTDFKRMPDGRIAIGLAAQDTHWAQYSFQFAHEFCHTLANFGNNSGRSGQFLLRANYWLEEALCETASLFTLRAMSRSWQTNPPIPVWRAYAPSFNDYAAQRIALPEHQFPGRRSFLEWFRQHQPAMRKEPADWDWNTIVAIELLPVFEAEPRGWESVTFLNRGSQSENESLQEYLAQWRSQCPADLRPFVNKIAAAFAISFTQ